MLTRDKLRAAWDKAIDSQLGYDDGLDLLVESVEPTWSSDVLDHGYLRQVETWGCDERIIEAARMSTDKGFLGWDPTDTTPGDQKLLSYLFNNNHATPFEMAGLIIEVKAPIMVFREWHRHRTQSYNEMSARYIPVPDEHYIPTVARLMMGGGTNKQAGGMGAALTEEQSLEFIHHLKHCNDHAQELYQNALDAGIPKELARCPMPVNRYSKMRASANLRNWLAFMTLRCDPKAQWEIRQYAHDVAEVIKMNFPRTYELWASKQRAA